MTFALTKTELSQFTNLLTELTSARGKIDQVVTIYNQQTEALRPPVEEAITGYNSILAKVRDFTSGISARGREELDNKSEKWLESDTGQSAEEWTESWETVELDDIDFQWPDELTIDLDDYLENLEDLPQAAEG